MSLVVFVVTWYIGSFLSISFEYRGVHKASPYIFIIRCKALLYQLFANYTLQKCDISRKLLKKLVKNLQE